MNVQQVSEFLFLNLYMESDWEKTVRLKKNGLFTLPEHRTSIAKRLFHIICREQEQ